MKILLTFFGLILSVGLFAQTKVDLDITLNSIVIDKRDEIPQEAKSRLEEKLAKIASENGAGGISINSRFVLAAKVNTNSKDIVPGPPQMVAVNLELTFLVGDAATNQIFKTTSIELKGVGGNENIALINAIRQINVKSKDLSDLVLTGKAKINDYYTQNCMAIKNKALSLGGQKKYEEALYELLQVPASSSSCFETVLPIVQELQQKEIDLRSRELYLKASTVWSTNPNQKGADEVAGILTKISPLYTNISEVKILIDQIREKIQENEKRNWNFKLLEYDNSIKLEELRIEAAKQTAIEYHRNYKPQVNIYNNYNRVYWW